MAITPKIEMRKKMVSDTAKSDTTKRKPIIYGRTSEEAHKKAIDSAKVRTPEEKRMTYSGGGTISDEDLAVLRGGSGVKPDTTKKAPIPKKAPVVGKKREPPKKGKGLKLPVTKMGKGRGER